LGEVSRKAKIFERAYLLEFTALGSIASCGLALVVFQRPAQPFSTLNGAIRCTFWTRRWEEYHIAFSLVRTFRVIMRQVFSQDVAK
jgi:hypothetical protein